MRNFVKNRGIIPAPHEEIFSFVQFCLLSFNDAVVFIQDPCPKVFVQGLHLGGVLVLEGASRVMKSPFCCFTSSAEVFLCQCSFECFDMVAHMSSQQWKATSLFAIWTLHPHTPAIIRTFIQTMRQDARSFQSWHLTSCSLRETTGIFFPHNRERALPCIWQSSLHCGSALHAF